MSRRFTGLAAVAAVACIAAPAAAQQFSDGYQFLDAIKKADGNKVMEILRKTGGSIIDTKERDSGQGAIHIVAGRGDLTYLRFLLQKGANPNLVDDRGNSAMIIAVEKGFAEGVQALVDAHANVNLANSSGETPLIRAVQLRNLDLVRILLAAGADPDQTDVIAGMSARDYAKTDTRAPAVAKMLADAPKLRRQNVAGPKF